MQTVVEQSVRIDPSWYEILRDEFEKPYFQELRRFLHEEKSQGHRVYPPGNRIFAAFDHTPFYDVKAVILGQDPYHGAGQANGLCFSVNRGIRKPPSLYNIFRELRDDMGFPIAYSGDLTRWADNGVLLLNATLTVRANEPRSHHGHGWEQFTSAAIAKLSDMRENLVFMLWGRDAQEKEHLIDEDKHLVLRAAHPSPYAAEKGFFGSRPFSECNDYLESCGLDPVDWNLEPDREY